MAYLHKACFGFIVALVAFDASAQDSTQIGTRGKVVAPEQ